MQSGIIKQTFAAVAQIKIAIIRDKKSVQTQPCEKEYLHHNSPLILHLYTSDCTFANLNHDYSFIRNAEAEKAKVSPSRATRAHWAALISVSIALS